MLNKWYVLFGKVNSNEKLLDLFAESEPKHEAGAGKSEREGKPDAGQSPVKDESEEVSGRQGNNEISNESDVHNGFYIGNAAEGIGIVALHPVAKLIDYEWKDEA